MSRRPFRTSAALAPALALAALASPAQAKTGPAQPNFVKAFAYSQAAPDVDPPGANDWDCKPTAKRPRPVVLVHGTFENRYNNWAYVSPKLKAAGYCVYALDYGDDPTSVVGLAPAVKGTGEIRRSARELARFVDKVRAQTGSAQVDLVGHSQGGLMPRQYLAAEGGATPKDPSKNKVRRLIALGATNHGTTLSGVGTLAAQLRLLGGGQILLGKAAIQQTKEAGLAREINTGGETRPGIGYTVIATRYDEISTPYQDAFLAAGPGASVHNVTLQDGCEINLADHLSLTYDPRALQLIFNALDPKNAKALPCVPTTPLFTLGTLAPVGPQGPDGPGVTTPENPVPVTPTTPTGPITATSDAETVTIRVAPKLRLPGISIDPNVTVQLPVLAPKK